MASYQPGRTSLRPRAADPVYGEGPSAGVQVNGPQYGLGVPPSLVGWENSFTPVESTFTYEGTDRFGRKKIPIEWRRVNVAPTISEYVQENLGDLGSMNF